MGLPAGYTSLLIADDRRAQQWQAGLSRAGFDVRLVDTAGVDADKGDYHICVATGDVAGGRAFVTDVLRGNARLPHVSRLSPLAVRALAGAVLTLVFLTVWIMLSR